MKDEMRIVIQRVSRASVTVEGRVVGAIGEGLLAFVGFCEGDDERLLPKVVDKMAGLRIFPDEGGNMNRSLEEVGGGVLAISQFTLHADIRKGRRPSFTKALAPAAAEALFGKFVDAVRARLTDGPVECGVFGAMMDVELVNAGPVTILLDSDDLAIPR